MSLTFALELLALACPVTPGSTNLCDFRGPGWGICDDPVNVHLCRSEDFLGPVQTCGVYKDEVASDWAHEQECCQKLNLGEFSRTRWLGSGHLAHCGRLSLWNFGFGTHWAFWAAFLACCRLVIQQRFVLLNGLRVTSGISCSARSRATVSPTMTPRWLTVRRLRAGETF